MELIVDNLCTNIIASTSTTNIIQDWVEGNLFDLQFTLSHNCNLVSTIDLPNNYVIQVSGLNSTIVGNTQSYTNLNLIFDTSTVQSMVLVSTSSGILNYTQVDPYSFTNVDIDTTSINTMNFLITDTRGVIYDFVITFTPVTGFGTVPTSELITSISCGIIIDEVNYTITLIGDYFSTTCTTDLDIVLCNGIYSFQLQEELSCVLVGCNLDCEIVDIFSEENLDIMLYYNALLLGSTKTSIGDTDCITCEELCKLYNKIAKQIGIESKIEKDGCGCN